MTLKTLLDEECSHLEIDGKGRTALIWAVLSGSREAVQLLLEKGADVNSSVKWGDDAGMTALMHTMVDSGKTDIAETLIDFGADLEFSFGYGYTALAFAMAADNYDGVSLQLEKGAKPFRKNQYLEYLMRVFTCNT